MLFLIKIFVSIIIFCFCYIKRVGIKSRIHNFIINLKYLTIDKSIKSQKYEGDINSGKRYLSIGFDDFRESDFSMVIPLFRKYKATSTFNRVETKMRPSKNELYRMFQVMKYGNELGDHTWFHYNNVYGEPLCNGQDPKFLEGNQIPFPSNEQLRNDYGDGKNAFGLNLNSSVKTANYGWKGYEDKIEFDTSWGNLTDEQCQKLRDYFSLYKDKSGILDLFDSLSNKYLGTTGHSFGSWNDEKGCYTEGIFTEAKSSCNHEVWERIIDVTNLYYKDILNKDFQFKTWSWPGDWVSPFYFFKKGQCYYDEACTKLKNYMAQFKSSITGKQRSFTSVLYEKGYRVTHDTDFPSKKDGVKKVMMSNQLVFNAFLSRKSALPYSTNRTVFYGNIADDYPKNFFKGGPKSKAAQMYDGKGSFYTIIEALRQNTSNGMVHGEVIDSVDSYSERVFLEELLKYCKQTGVEVISKAKAYDVCFNHSVQDGNLIYNPTFRNTAKEFLKDAERVPPNPDGYIGDCLVMSSDGKRRLCISGKTTYLHYGIPLGKIEYSVFAKGKGEISIYAIKNNTPVEHDDSDLLCFGRVSVNSNEGKTYLIDFDVPDNPETEYEQICGGLGEKIMGIKIVYSGGLEIEKVDLRKE